MIEGFVGQLPDGPLWVPLVVVFVGSALQVATGVGLGLIAAPAILLVLDGPSAIQVAIILNLTLSALLLPFEFRQVATNRLFTICRWAIVGVPLGGLVLMAVGDTSLKLLCGVVVLASLVQLRYFPLPVVEDAGSQRWLNRIGGVVSGGMTSALAAPGPVALWALLSAGLDVVVVRATLRAYFLFAYVVAFVANLALFGSSGSVWMMALLLLPAVFAGIGAGVVGRRYLAASVMRATLEMGLLIMGIAMLVKGVSDAGGF